MPVNWDLVKKGKELPGLDRISHTTYHENELWIAGRGKRPARLMIVGQNPGRDELEQKDVFVDRAGEYMGNLMLRSGLREFDPYLTYAVKYGTLNNAPPKKGDIKTCLQALMNEIEEVKPDLIITLGACALEAVCGKQNNKWYKISDTRGEFIEPEWLGGTKVLSLWHPGYILRNPEKEGLMLADLEKAVTFLRGGDVTSTVYIAPFDIIESNEQFGDWLLDAMEASGKRRLQLSMDSEWHGANPDAPGAYLRTVQISAARGERTAVIRLYPTSTVENPVDPTKQYPNCADTRVVMWLLSQFLKNTKGSSIFGQNIIADGVWFMKYGLDIRPYTTYDTMLAEHLIDNRGPFNLTDMTLKYAPKIGRYDRWLKEWTNNHPELVTDGYGYIPEDILFPYGAGDVQAPWQIMKAQLPQLEEQGHFIRLGHENQYPCLFETVINLSRHLYELHQTGILVDRERLAELTVLFNERVAAMRIKLGNMAALRGFSEFNPNSTPQKQALLFGPPEKAPVDPDDPSKGVKDQGGLGLTPLKSTGKRPKAWEWVMRQPPAVSSKYNPSTDGETLETMQDRHPLVRELLNYNRINTVCKNFLREDETGGINGNIYPDDRIHSSFSQLTNTGRLRSREPNCQNFPKASEGYIRDIFADKKKVLLESGKLGPKDEYPPSIRTVFVPPPGYIIIECDYSQAELFVTAGISEDAVMMDLLMTPGKDLHDKTTIESFKPTVYMPDGTPYNEEYMLTLAARSEKEFEAEQDKLFYVDPKGKKMTRGEFKDTMRVSGKSVNFGILYGRGARAIAQQINAETGLGVTPEEIQIGIDGWHNTYTSASAFFSACHKQALDVGYIANIWGRRRWFGKAENRSQESSIEREAANHPIQGTVGDTMSLAIDRIANEKLRQGLRFKIINQVHDALLFEVPEDEVEKSTELIRWGMGEIELPMPGGPLKLGVDIDFYTRWGEKIKKKAS